jgi:hypothetical protein
VRFRTGWVAVVALVLVGFADGSAAAPGGGPVTVVAAADATAGRGAAEESLRTCPASCATVLRFEVPAGPGGSVVRAARLELHTAAAVRASVAAYPAGGAPAARLSTRTGLTAGWNSWDVTPAVRGAGTVSLALGQSQGPAVRWASRECPDATLRPRLVVLFSGARTD